MAGIVSATQAQIVAARKALQKLSVELEQLTNGPLPKASALSTRQAARIDAKVQALVAAIAPLNT
jgi:phosphatidate phosphatase APP1